MRGVSELRTPERSRALIGWLSGCAQRRGRTHCEVVEVHGKFGGRYHDPEQVCGPRSTQTERTARSRRSPPTASDGGLGATVNIAQ